MIRPLSIVLPLVFGLAAGLSAQQGGRSSPPLPQLPQTFETAVQKIRVSVVAGGLANPWSLAFLPNGDMLVTERAGRISFERGRPIQREPILTELHQRIRDVRQGPDGLLYLLTDENPGVVLRIEPVP
jgi:glucose/arabinose dehydrogenase